MADCRERTFVAAIEFGSTYSGYAWSSKEDFQREPLRIQHPIWKAGSKPLMTYKTPATLLLNPDESFRSFGYEAQNEYSHLCQKDETYKDYFYFNRFNEIVNNNTAVKTTELLKAAHSDKKFYAPNIFAHAIRYFKDHLFQYLTNNVEHIRSDDILFVLVMPSNWDDEAVKCIQEAATMADVPTDKQLIVSECEAALAYYHFFLEKKVADRREVHKPGRRTLIVDIADGTLEISVVKKNQTDGYIKEFHKIIDKIGNGGPADEALVCFLDEVIGNGSLEELRKESLGDYIALLREFEIIKRCITTEKRGKMSVELPMVLLDIIKKQKNNLSRRITQSKYLECVRYLEGKVQIDVQTLSEVFKRNIDCVINKIDDILCSEKFFNIEHIFLHGGFAECQLLQQAMLDKYSNDLILIPELAELAVMGGAVLRGQTSTEIYIAPEKNIETSPGDVRVKSSPTVVESRIPDPPTLIEKKKSLNDHSLLFKAIMERNKDETERLLDANMDPLFLNEISKTLFHIAFDTNQPEIVKLISTVICKQFKSYIQSKYGNLLYKTWIGYTLEQGSVDLEDAYQNICIVGIYTKQPPCTLCKYFRDIPIRWRQKEEVSDEGRMTSQYENINVNFENTIPPELAKTLFNEHSNLTIVHFSSVKSTNFSTELSKIVEKPCIALYCHIKGIIPLGEKLFHETVGAFGLYEIDVREGYCTLNHGNLQPGTAIYCPRFNQDGTTGGFVENSNGEIAFITAAHIVTNCELRRLCEKDQEEFLKSNEILVYKKTNNEPIGRVAQWRFDTETYNETSIDAAIIEVDKRIISTASTFPDTNPIQWNQAGYSSSNLPRICTRKIIPQNEIFSNRKSDVIKYGMSKKNTIGNLILNKAYVKPFHDEVRLDHVNASGVYDSAEFVMCCMMGVQGKGGQPFSKAGDSGAFCCFVDQDDELIVRSFGMIIGGSTLGVSFVTPLENVFQALGLDFSTGITLYPQSQTGDLMLQQLQQLNASKLEHIVSLQHDIVFAQQQMISKQEQMVSKQQEMALEQQLMVSKQQETVFEQQQLRQTFDARLNQDQKIIGTIKEQKHIQVTPPEKSVETSPGDVWAQSSPTVVESHIPLQDPSTLVEKKKLKKDNKPLFEAIIGRNKEETESLLNANMDPLLPNEFGETPFHIALKTEQQDVVKVISTVICEQFRSYIQSKYGNLLYKTWIGYTLKQGYVDLEEPFQNICIVAIYTKQPPCAFCMYFRHISIRWRQQEEVSDEGKMTSQFENNDVNFGNKIPPELAKSLFNKHSNLNIVHFSSVKSTNFPTELREMVKKPCLALYCHIKGIIPLGEKQFKETVSDFAGYEIDVREGYCYLNQGHIRPGTAIYCPTFSNNGTAGGFVEDSFGLTAIVTAAHVVTNCELRRYGEYEKQEFLSQKDIRVHDKTNSQLIGKVKTWCFENGNYDQTSVDAAIIEVDRRIISIDSMFPDTSPTQWNQAGYTSSNYPRMCTRKLMSRDEISSNRRLDVIKYGMSSEITIGNLIYDGAYFKLHRAQSHADDITPFNMVYDSDDYVMCRQLGVQGRGGQHFSKAGDSGAFCCMIDNDDETVVRAFGMIIAGSTSGVSFVTPLENVFQALGLDVNEGIKLYPQNSPTQGATANPQYAPTQGATANPQYAPTQGATANPQYAPTQGATANPQYAPTQGATANPQYAPTQGATANPQYSPTQGATNNQPMPNQTLDPILQQLQQLNASFQQMVSKQEQIVSKQQEMVSEQQQMRETFDARFHLQDEKIDSIAKDRKS